MNEQEKKIKLHEYQEKYRFWTDKRISQLSFHNNLFITLGFVVIGYFWSERKTIYTEITFNFDADIDIQILLFLLAMLAVTASIITGFMLSLSRLYDLRLTSNIILTRKRLLNNNMDIKDEVLLQPKFRDSIKSLFNVFWRYQY